MVYLTMEQGPFELCFNLNLCFNLLVGLQPELDYGPSILEHRLWIVMIYYLHN